MGCFDECMDTIMEPYGGNMPLFRNPDTTDATVTIVQESYDDGMSVTRINTPPRMETRTLLDAINNILGIMVPMEKEPEKKGGDKSGVSDGHTDSSEKERRSGSEDKQDRVAEETKPKEGQENKNWRGASRPS